MKPLTHKSFEQDRKAANSLVMKFIALLFSISILASIPWLHKPVGQTTTSLALFILVVLALQLTICESHKALIMNITMNDYIEVFIRKHNTTTSSIKVEELQFRIKY